MRPEEYREINEACLAALASGVVKVKSVPVANDGVIDIDEYIEQLKEEGKEWAYRIESL